MPIMKKYVPMTWAIALLAFCVSYLGKWLADVLLDRRVALIGDFVGLQPSRNPGIAFGLRLPDVLQTPVILCAIALLVFAARKADTSVAKVGFGLLLGGALGNVVDRLFDGYVTDFFQVGTFPIFNVADSCISIGVVLLVLDGLGMVRQSSHDVR